MNIGQTQVFLLVVGIFAVVGWVRGWQREVITCAIVLATVLFLSLGLGDALAQLFTHGSQSLIPTAAAHPLSGGGPNGPSAPGTSGSGSGGPGSSGSTSGAYCSLAVTGQILSNVIFVGMTFLGYRLGTIYAPVAKTASHRLTGMIPGALNGAAMMYYLSRSVFAGQQIKIESPSPAAAGGYLPIVFLFAIIGVLVVLFITSQSKKAAK